MNPTARKQTLRALDMRTTANREEFFQFQHGDSRLRIVNNDAEPPPGGSNPYGDDRAAERIMAVIARFHSDFAAEWRRDSLIVGT